MFRPTTFFCFWFRPYFLHGGPSKHRHLQVDFVSQHYTQTAWPIYRLRYYYRNRLQLFGRSAFGSFIPTTWRSYEGTERKLWRNVEGGNQRWYWRKSPATRKRARAGGTADPYTKTHTNTNTCLLDTELLYVRWQKVKKCSIFSRINYTLKATSGSQRGDKVDCGKIRSLIVFDEADINAASN